VKKALIITYYWPPAGGPGVQRWLKFVKYLPTFGVEPIVYIPENPTYPIIDESLLADVPSDITIIKRPITEPYKHANKVSRNNSEELSKGIIHKPERQTLVEKLMLFVRGNFFIPDARKNWVKPSVSFLSEYLIKHEIKTVITTGPPHSLHLIGLQLKDQLNIKWFADFRDPWTTIGYHKKLKLLPMAKLKHKTLEKKVLSEADHIIVTSFNTQNDFEAITENPISVITNGYDEEIVAATKLDEKFTLSHIGSMLSDRDPHVLWEVLSDLIIEDNIFQSHFQLNLIGTTSDDILASLEKYGLTQFVNVKGYVNHEKALKYQRKSQVLLLVEIDSEETRCIIPGKLFEYMRSNRPIIALGPIGSDVEHILQTTQTGFYFSYEEKKALKESIKTLFEAFRNNNLQSKAINLEQYSRKALTSQLASLILK
jgi:hypothetical protein